MAFVWALLGFAALIVLHEGGHFLAAKAVGMRVERFSLFFGPMWLRRRVGETEYGIASIPLGGYVKISGMNPEEVYTGALAERYPGGAAEDPRAYVNQPVWKRIVVIAAGPFVNLIVAFLIFAAVLNLNGLYGSGKGYVVGQVEASSPAAGHLRPGDRIVSIDGFTTPARFEAAIAASRCAGGVRTDGCVATTPVAMVVLRHGRRIAFSVHPRYNASAGRFLIGFSYGPPVIHEAVSPGRAAHLSLAQMGHEIAATFHALSHLYQAKERRQLHSVAGVYVAAEQATSQGTAEGVWVLGGISLALAIVNLLPFLPLDGGHIFWALVEKVRRRRVSLATMERASWVGLALVLGLFVIGFSNDISTFIHGGNFLSGH